MVEYISREAASDLLAMALIDDWEPEYARDRLSEIPAADVRPVLHAEWEQVMGKYDKLFRCSRCHFIPIEPHYFCQNCGADMREVKADG